MARMHEELTDLTAAYKQSMAAGQVFNWSPWLGVLKDALAEWLRTRGTPLETGALPQPEGAAPAQPEELAVGARHLSTDQQDQQMIDFLHRACCTVMETKGEKLYLKPSKGVPALHRTAPEVGEMKYEAPTFEHPPGEHPAGTPAAEAHPAGEHPTGATTEEGHPGRRKK